MQDLITNKFLIVPICCWAAIQLFKFLTALIIDRRIDFKRLIGAGGMPSSHSAVVTSLAAMIGKECGVGSPMFAMSCILAAVVMYDAAGIRRAAGKQAKLLNKIVETPGLTNAQVGEKLAEVLGHTPLQVFIGAIIGIIAGILI